MVHFNKVTILGTLAQNPTFSGQGNDKLGQFMIGTALRFMNREDNEVTQTQWFRVSFFGDMAQSLEDANLSQDDEIYLEGRLSIFEYDEEGETKTSLEIFGEQFASLKSTTAPQPSGIEPDPSKLPDRVLPKMPPLFP